MLACRSHLHQSSHPTCRKSLLFIVNTSYLFGLIFYAPGSTTRGMTSRELPSQIEATTDGYRVESREPGIARYARARIYRSGNLYSRQKKASSGQLRIFTQLSTCYITSRLTLQRLRTPDSFHSCDKLPAHCLPLVDGLFHRASSPASKSCPMMLHSKPHVIPASCCQLFRWSCVLGLLTEIVICRTHLVPHATRIARPSP